MENQNDQVQPGKTQEIHFVDESFRMDDNSNISELAQEESEGMNDPLVPGLGVENDPEIL
ncbi:MAG: hypothetical protein LBQ60_07890 [Bacteroidales bacterium]|jgi:hypothetical protein|nr:hypothetical protein [Bacteroidales bacterium]